MGCVGDIDFTVAVGVCYGKLFFGKWFKFGKVALDCGYVADFDVSVEVSVADIYCF